MRLLYAPPLSSLEGFPQLDLRYFANAYDCPPYAILSHTWGADEVLFHDILSGDFSQKQSWVKIRSALKQTREDGNSYLWVDTCCIDKSSSAELSEAINSMFDWYEQAAICYVYLSDVRDLYESSDRDEFVNSRWFVRGWTLQELIAPPDVAFFDSNWSYITKRSSAATRLGKITGIGEAVLRSDRGNLGAVLQGYSVAQRLAWASGRHTTRLEDQAYSLLGLFGVNMPLLYGEGSKAFKRLQTEILRANTDLSILAWNSTSGVNPGDILANSLMDFARCTDTVLTTYSAEDIQASETSLTNVGYTCNCTHHHYL